jgi:hypothetical protein
MNRLRLLPVGSFAVSHSSWLLVAFLFLAQHAAAQDLAPPPVETEVLGTDDASPSSLSEAGATTSAVLDDTASLQAAINALPAGGTLRFPARVYRIRADVGLNLKSGITLDLGKATLVAANVTNARCRIFTIDGDRGVTIAGGTLVGSRTGAPQWGVGILASDAQDLVIQGVTLRSFYTDGILLTGNHGCRRVAIRNTVSEGNRRSGMSVVAASDLSVEASVFRGSVGQSPEAGVNCEPNAGGDVARLRFQGSTFEGNHGIGLYVHRGLGKSASAATVAQNLVRNNDQGIVIDGVSGVSVVQNRVFGHSGVAKSGIVLGAKTSGDVAANRVEGNFRGILSLGASAVTIRSNQVIGLGPISGPTADADGIVCRGLTASVPLACVVSGNVVSRFAGTGILAQLVNRVTVTANAVDAIGQRGLWLRDTTHSDVTQNRLSRIDLRTPLTHQAIELTDRSHYNRVLQNVCYLGLTARGTVGVGSGCVGNQVAGNSSGS